MAQIILRGPVWTLAAPLLMEETRRKVESTVSAETAREVALLGLKSFRYESSPPTWKWRAHVHSLVRADYHVATDSGIIYGHWLEGTGSRNRTTRFKGYFLWRRTFQKMERTQALAIAQPIVDRAVRALNG